MDIASLIAVKRFIRSVVPAVVPLIGANDDDVDIVLRFEIDDKLFGRRGRRTAAGPFLLQAVRYPAEALLITVVIVVFAAAAVTVMIVRMMVKMLCRQYWVESIVVVTVPFVGGVATLRVGERNELRVLSTSTTQKTGREKKKEQVKMRITRSLITRLIGRWQTQYDLTFEETATWRSASTVRVLDVWSIEGRQNAIPDSQMTRGHGPWTLSCELNWMAQTGCRRRKCYN